MKSFGKYEGIKYSEKSSAKTDDFLIVEAPLQITINDKPFTVVMQTPGSETALTLGLLYAEDVIDQRTAYTLQEEKDEQGTIINVHLTIPADQIRDGYKSSRSLLSVSSCGICGKQSLDDLPKHEGQTKLKNNHETWSIPTLLGIQNQMFEKQELFTTTGGCHGVAAFDEKAEFLTIHEDVGRHNALDKVIGTLLQNAQLSDAKVLAFSGRVSYEIVSKAFRAKIQVIIAVSAPSTLAIDFAKEFGITILGFSRNGKTTCYSHCHRIQPIHSD